MENNVETPESESIFYGFLGPRPWLGLVVWNLPVFWLFIAVPLSSIGVSTAWSFGLKASSSWLINTYLYGILVVCLLLFVISSWFRKYCVFMVLYWVIAINVGKALTSTTDGAFRNAIERACSAVDSQLEETERKREVEGKRSWQR
jgi:hypothetical protein